MLVKGRARETTKLKVISHSSAFFSFRLLEFFYFNIRLFILWNGNDASSSCLECVAVLVSFLQLMSRNQINLFFVFCCTEWRVSSRDNPFPLTCSCVFKCRESFDLLSWFFFFCIFKYKPRDDRITLHNVVDEGLGYRVTLHDVVDEGLGYDLKWVNVSYTSSDDVVFSLHVRENEIHILSYLIDLVSQIST